MSGETKLNGQLRIETLAHRLCFGHIGQMLNIVSILVGILSLVIVIPATIPLLGWANWFALPVIVIGIIIGQLSSKNTGRNFNLIVLLIAVIRLSLGGGII